MELTLFAPGTEVEVGPISGHVTEVEIKFGGCVRYKVSGWSGEDFREGYFDSFMVTPIDNTDRLKLGFYTGKESK